VSRLPQTLVALALLAATASAFAVTEHLKLERSPITGTRVDKIFSPVCECPRDFAVVSFILRRPETVTLKIVDSDGETVRTLVRDRPEAKGRVSYTWDGRDDLDRVVPEGAYRPRAELRRNGRTIVMPNTMRVDTTAPVITLASVRPRVVSPDGDGTRDRVTARYRLDEQARPELLVNDTRQALGRFGKLKGVRASTRYGSVRSTAPGTGLPGRGRCLSASATWSSSATAWRSPRVSASRSSSGRTPTPTHGSSRAGGGRPRGAFSGCERRRHRVRTLST
jgi:hypothetical protein